MKCQNTLWPGCHCLQHLNDSRLINRSELWQLYCPQSFKFRSRSNKHEGGKSHSSSVYTFNQCDYVQIKTCHREICSHSCHVGRHRPAQVIGICVASLLCMAVKIYMVVTLPRIWKPYRDLLPSTRGRVIFTDLADSDRFLQPSCCR